MRDEEAVDHVEVGRSATVHPHDDAVLDHELGLRIVRARSRRRARARRSGVTSSSRRSSFAAREANRADAPDSGSGTEEPSLDVRRAQPRGRRRAVSGAPTRRAVAPSLELLGRRAPGPQRRVDLEELVVGHASELGRALEVVRELRPSRRPGNLRLPSERRGRRADVGGDERPGPRSLERDLVERRAPTASRRGRGAASRAGSRRLGRSSRPKLYRLTVMTNDHRFFGRVALVTGAASGIGAATVEQAARRGREGRGLRPPRPAPEGVLALTGDVSASADVERRRRASDGGARPDRHPRLLGRRLRATRSAPRT